MRTPGVIFVAVVAAAAALSPAPAEPAERVRVAEVTAYRPERGGDKTIVYPLAVLKSAGWENEQVLRAIREVQAVFSHCGVSVAAGSVYWLDAPDEFLELEESMQPRLLAVLPPARPAALLVGQTTDRDVAYAYLASAPIASRATAWVTRNSHPGCLGTLLAHELGHVLLDSPHHPADPANLMSHTCTVTNWDSPRRGVALNQAQCQKLREW